MTRLPGAGDGLAPTPVVRLEVEVAGTPRELWLKLEGYNPYGSIKGRTALALWRDVADRVAPDAGLVESTSGNLGLALAALAAAHRVPFTAVVDPRTSASLLYDIRALGARVVTVDVPDGAGGYLLNRLARVRALLRDHPGLVWTDQYRNPANPAAHAAWTAPELHWQTRGARLSVLVAVSTGGTLAGFRQYAAESGADWELVGVDAAGSAALGGAVGPRLLSGLGASRPSVFLPDGHRPTVYVDPGEAVAMCLWLRDTTGIGVGASAGALVAAALRLFLADAGRTGVACLCPDGADRYLDTVYSPDWRRAHGMPAPAPLPGVRLLTTDGPGPLAEGVRW
ncbi:pyridoxal-phosphate dependent enzyme [Streptomyces sp. NPDC013455]|uniref:pyridoxal-phosphate dependent enzyme n=1 Tax=Streptomyces sp. NPDC013455 TaxID=3155605 RepID=UPI0033C77625